MFQECGQYFIFDDVRLHDTLFFYNCGAEYGARQQVAGRDEQTVSLLPWPILLDASTETC